MVPRVVRRCPRPLGARRGAPSRRLERGL